MTLLLIRSLIFLSAAALGGCVGAWVAGRFGRDRRVGFALGAGGGVGGWMLAAIRPHREDREDGLVRALNRVYMVAGATLAALHAATLVWMTLVMLLPERFGWLVVSPGSWAAPQAWSLVAGVAPGAMALLWVLSWAVLLRDGESLHLPRVRWMLGLSAYFGALMYAPVRQRAVTAAALSAGVGVGPVVRAE